MVLDDNGQPLYFDQQLRTFGLSLLAPGDVTYGDTEAIGISISIIIETNRLLNRYGRAISLEQVGFG
jgi:hypothetical protein